MCKIVTFLSTHVVTEVFLFAENAETYGHAENAETRSRVLIRRIGGTAITKGKTPVPVCSPKLSPAGRG